MTGTRAIATFSTSPTHKSTGCGWLAAATLAVTVGLASPALAQCAPKVKFATSEGDFVVEGYPDKAPNRSPPRTHLAVQDGCQALRDLA